ncbi:MAG: septal ring lytic transglycosylase RlpA family lipoprotein, partial [Gammaproteobacteria bacterium]
MNRILRFGTLFISLILLAACTSMNNSSLLDGPPKHDVNESKVPDAKPQVEPRSKYGNPPSYVVHGKRYHVLKSSHGYHERGVASWYGTKF